MAKQASKTVIGSFVIIAMALLIGGVIIFGGGKFFKKTDRFVMFFETSVKGLNVGAPVVIRGVEVGEVESIILRGNRENGSINIPVIVAIDPNKMEIEDTSGKESSSQENAGRLIKQGLRAQLGMESLITGQLMIEADFYPDTPARLTGLYPELPEIPTRQSSLGQLAQKIKDLPIKKIADKLIDAIDSVDKLVSSPRLMDIVNNLDIASKNLNQTIVDTDKTINAMGQQVAAVLGGFHKVVADAQVTIKDIDAAAGDARNLLKNADRQIHPLSSKAQDALVSAKQAMDKAKTTLATLDGFVGPRSDTRNKLNRALDEVAAAGNSLESLTDYLERHPEALLKGK